VKILVVEDDPGIAEVLDVGLPDLDGFEVCRRIRKTSDVPILFLTSRSDEIDRVVGLEIGGDDCLTKPFSTRARGTITRQSTPGQGTQVTVRF